MKNNDIGLRSMVFIHPFLLTFHYARMHVLMNMCQNAGISLHNIALAGSYHDYKWFFTNDQARSDSLALFPNQSLESIPQNELWASLKTKLDELKPEVVFIYGYSLKVMRQVKSWADKHEIAIALISDSNESNRNLMMRQVKSWADKHEIAIALISDSNEFDRKRYGVMELFKRFYVSRMDAAFVGGTSSSSYMQRLGIPKERITVGYDVIDNELFCRQAQLTRVMRKQAQQKWSLPENYFLFVGRLIKEKNLLRLLEAYVAYARTETQPWSLVICGEGPEHQELQDFVNRLPAEIIPKILFYGHIKQPEIIDFYSNASCFVLPSLSESWGLVVNEAMACSLPVLVSSQCGCAADLVVDGCNGWRVDPTDCSQLNGLMTKMSTLNASARIRMGLNSQEIVAQWGLDTFAQNAIECAKIAINHRNQKSGIKNGSN